MEQAPTNSAIDVLPLLSDAGDRDDTNVVTITGRWVDVAKQRYPYCLVWSPIPIITYVSSTASFSLLCC